jgi:DNA-binding transcriptional MerR regulator
MSKAAEAFRTIGEVADELLVPKHVLRFWESKFPQIKPMKRGGGRRYYRPEDMELLRGIRHLLHAEGYTIKGVQKILREHGIDQVKAAAPDVVVAVAPTKDAPKRGRKPMKARDGKPRETAGVKAAADEPDIKPKLPKSGDRRAQLSAVLIELQSVRALLIGHTAAAMQKPKSEAAKSLAGVATDVRTERMRAAGQR